MTAPIDRAIRPALAESTAPRRPGVPTAVSADLLAPPSHRLGALLLSLIGLVIAFLLWATFARIEEVATGRGRVIPASKIQLIQNLEGGIVREILAREGARVREGDVLLRIDPTLSGASLGEAREKLLGLTALVARLEAEVENKPLVFPPMVIEKRPDFVNHQSELFETRRRELQAATSALDLLERQRLQEVLETEARMTTLARATELAREELEIIRRLERTRAASRSELITIETKFNETQGARTAAELALPRLRAAAGEVRDRRNEKVSAFRSDALQRLAAAQIDLAALTEGSRGAEDKVSRTTIRAPVTGIVKTVHVTTPGQVIQPGHNLVEIVPLNDTLLVEAQVRPQDIAFLRPGQAAKVKITAYDAAIYGALDGELEQIGADSVSNEKGEAYYVIRVRTKTGHLTNRGEALAIMPGMVADVDVITGAKTVLGYLTKPLIRMRDGALREK